MLTIKQFIFNPLQENCYVVSDETKECIIIDCGAFEESEAQQVLNYIHDEQLTLRHHLLTHGHFDHIMGAERIANATGVKPQIHAADEKLYKDISEQTRQLMGMSVDVTMPALERCLKNGDEVTFGNTSFKVIATPGHSQGSIMYYCDSEKVAFSGDTLFRGSIGRTDFTGGSMFQIINSLRYIAQMNDSIRIYPGHGEETTLGYELAHNPYMDR